MIKPGGLPNGGEQYTKYIKYRGEYIVIKGLEGGDLYKIGYKENKISGDDIENIINEFIEEMRMKGNRGLASRIENRKETIVSRLRLEGYYKCPEKECKELRSTVYSMKIHLTEEHNRTDTINLTSDDFEEYTPESE